MRSYADPFPQGVPRYADWTQMNVSQLRRDARCLSRKLAPLRMLVPRVSRRRLVFRLGPHDGALGVGRCGLAASRLAASSLSLCTTCSELSCHRWMVTLPRRRRDLAVARFGGSDCRTAHLSVVSNNPCFFMAKDRAQIEPCRDRLMHVVGIGSRRAGSARSP